jgi:hypothetical protein
VDRLSRWQLRDKRPMVVLYAGDHDASGGGHRPRLPRAALVADRGSAGALLPEHVQQYGLPRSPFEKDDSRAASFVARHGPLWQTELDALDPDDLRALFEQAFEQVWDQDVYQERIEAERRLIEDVLGEAA